MIKIGHRGACGYEPENTLRSFKKAISLGVDMIELDVHLSKDGHLIVIHDNTLERTTNGEGKVSDLTLKELKKLDAGKGETIPILKEVFDLVDKRVKINIELKGKNVATSVNNLINEYIKKGWTYDHFLVSSFYFNELKRFNKLNKKIKIGVLFENFPWLYLRRAKRIGAYSINPPQDNVTPKFISRARSYGLKIFVWNVNENKDISHLKDLSVDGIFSNYPDRL